MCIEIRQLWGIFIRYLDNMYIEVSESYNSNKVSWQETLMACVLELSSVICSYDISSLESRFIEKNQLW